MVENETDQDIPPGPQKGPNDANVTFNRLLKVEPNIFGTHSAMPRFPPNKNCCDSIRVRCPLRFSAGKLMRQAQDLVTQFS